MGRTAPTWRRIIRRSSRDYIDRLRGYLAQAEKGNTEAAPQGLEREKERAARLGERIAEQAPVGGDEDTTDDEATDDPARPRAQVQTESRSRASPGPSLDSDLPHGRR